MMLASNAFFFRKPGSRHRAGKRVQAKKALLAQRLDRATRVTDEAFPMLAAMPRNHDERVVMELIRAVEDMVEDVMVEEVGGDIIWPAETW